MKNQDTVRRIKKALSWDFADIRRAADSGAKMGAFILGSCFLDHLACLYFNKDSDKDVYERFICTFLPQYAAQDFRRDLRNRLVHNYTSGEKYFFVDRKPDLHLQKNGSGISIVNLEDFIYELEEVKNEFLLWLDGESEKTENNCNAIDRVDKVGILGPSKLP